MRLKFLTLNLYFCFWVFNSAAITQANEQIIGIVDTTELKRVEAVLSVPEGGIDFAMSKLIIDQIIDPNTDIQREMLRLEKIVNTINAMDLNSSMEKKNALQHYLYDAGHWNQYRPFTYDFDDPKGTNIKNKLLGNYLNNRKGNCISMPFLFIVLGQKLGLDVSASTAPQHVFVKFTDDVTGKTDNLETTSGANVTRDSWVRQGFPMTDMAVKKGAYLQKLSQKETVAVMANTLLQHYYEQKQFGQLIATADLILNQYSKLLAALLYKAAAYNELLKVHGLWHYRRPSDVSVKQRAIFEYLVSRVNRLHNQTVRLGWHPPSLTENDAYLKKVEQGRGN